MCGSCGHSPCNCDEIYIAHDWYNITNFPCNPCTPSEGCEQTFPSECVTFNGPFSTCHYVMDHNVQAALIFLLNKVCELETALNICCNVQPCPAPQAFTVTVFNDNQILGGYVDVGDPLVVNIPAGTVIDIIIITSEFDVTINGGYSPGTTNLNPEDAPFVIAADIPLQLVPLNRYYPVTTPLYFTSSGLAYVRIYIR